MDKYWKLYEELNLEVKPLIKNYTPDKFGRILLADAFKRQSVSYASNSDVFIDDMKESDEQNR